MFRNKLKYYHGTSQKKWEKIVQDGKFLPSHIKKVGHYWITKGAYFVCENPFIALWYAHIAALADKSIPIVVCIEYEIEKDTDKQIVNLLTSDGHKLLASVHNMFKEKLNLAQTSLPGVDENMDSYVLELLMTKSSKMSGIIASFQEGESFQNMILRHEYTNRYVPYQKGFSPGDHVEICFYPELKLDHLAVSTLSKKEILQGVDPTCNIWELVCQGLTSPLSDELFKDKLTRYLNN